MARRKTSHNGTGHAPLSDDGVETDPLRDIASHAAELREHVQTLTQAVLDQLAAGARNRLYRFVLLSARIVIAVALTTAAAIFILYGMAFGLTELCGHAWLGFTLAGILFIAAMALSALVIRRKAQWRRQKGLKQKYAAKDIPSPCNFGRVADRHP